MGQKSRTKKNRKPQSTKAQAQNNRKVDSSIMPESLRGGAAPMPARNVATIDIQTDYIRADIIRILLLLIVVALIITGIFLASQKTSHFATAGDKLTKFLQLQ